MTHAEALEHLYALFSAEALGVPSIDGKIRQIERALQRALEQVSDTSEIFRSYVLTSKHSVPCFRAQPLAFMRIAFQA